MNRAHAHSRLNAALDGICKSGVIDKSLTEWVAEAYGRQVRIDEALIVAIKFLPEPLHADHADFFDRAFAKLGMKRPGDRTNACAKALFSELRRRKRRAAWAWATAMKIRPQ